MQVNGGILNIPSILTFSSNYNFKKGKERMSYIQVFDRFPIWALLIFTTLVFCIAAELGFRVGKFIHERRKKDQNPMVGTILGASLGLFAFFLAFTFNMATSRYDARKKLVLDEANAIEKTYLRAKLLPKPYCTEFQDLLRKYIYVRAQFQKGNFELVQQLIAESEEIHDLLWSKVITMTGEGNYSGTTTLFVNALNDIIELHGKRVNVGLHNRIPISIFLTLYFVGFLAMAMMGYQSGLSGVRSPIASLALILTFSIVLILITDLERPRQEIFSVSQKTLVDLNSKISRKP